MVIREKRSCSLALSVSPSLADSTYLSLSLLLLGDPFLGNVLAGAGAASSLCIPPANQAPKATCRPSSAFLCLAPGILLAPALSNTTLRDRDSTLGLICRFLFFFPSLQLWEAIFLSEGWGKISALRYLHYLEVHFVFRPPGGLFLQESGCWKRDRPLCRLPAPPPSLKRSYLLRAPGASLAERVCVCVCLCVRV